MTLTTPLRVRALGLALVGLFLLPAPARADLHDYLKQPDASFAWKLKGTKDFPGGKAYNLELVSQTWHDITWKHDLLVFRPKESLPARTMLLMNTGDATNPRNQFLAMELARQCKGPVAILFGVPNQPLLGDRKEDGLIAETFVRALETKDETWPLLFPMVKSVLKAMDALQAFVKEEWKEEVKDFVVTGGSKRGWTAWLTGASGDPRVKAIAPMVIDTLNMKPQMEHQLRSFGRYSDMIHDYTERKLVPMPDTKEALRLWGIVDPYFYREKLTLPKLMILGNNDPYWTVDALNLYWDGLTGPKWVTYVPNAGHDLQEIKEDGKKDGTRVVGALSAFARHQMTDKPLPKVTWKHDDDGGKMRLTVEASPAPKGARLWTAQAPTRDFRKERWEERPATLKGGTVVGNVDPPAEGFRAFYAELDYEIDGVAYHLSTQLRVAGK